MRHVTLWRHQGALVAMDDETNPLPVCLRDPDEAHADMLIEGWQRLTDAYPDVILHRNRVPDVNLDEVYIYVQAL